MDTSASNGDADKAEAVQSAASVSTREPDAAESPKPDDIAFATPLSSFLDCIPASLMAALAARPRFSRVTVLAVSIAIAAALGSMVGAWAAVTFVRPPSEPVRTMIASAEANVAAKLSADIAVLRASVEALAKNSGAQLARINERVERSEKAQNEPAAKLARLADAVEKLERKAAAPAASASAAVVPEITGSIVPKQPDRPSVVSGWVLREVFDGAAMVESRYGLYEVVPGANLPGLGRVETIRRQDGRWVVVTPKGLIVSSR
ncbi:MAG: hypothetical protein RO009_08255 [Pseudorhodoplanes sp.]|jgi:hypothetical protein|nr:hypothetical protein [Pseudorhodoplanes sp.]